MKSKRNFGGTWEGTAHIAGIEQCARIALTAWQNVLDAVHYSVKPMFIYKGSRFEPAQIQPSEQEADAIKTWQEAQRMTRQRIILFLQEVGMHTDANVLTQLDYNIMRDLEAQVKALEEMTR